MSTMFLENEIDKLQDIISENYTNKEVTISKEVLESAIRIMRGAIQEIKNLETERSWRY